MAEQAILGVIHFDQLFDIQHPFAVLDFLEGERRIGFLQHRRQLLYHFLELQRGDGFGRMLGHRSPGPTESAEQCFLILVHWPGFQGCNCLFANLR